MPQQLFGLQLANGIDQSQQANLSNLIGSGRAFNNQDASNFARTFGLTDPQRYIGITGQKALEFAKSFSPFANVRSQSAPTLNQGQQAMSMAVPQVLSSNLLNSTNQFNSVNSQQDNSDITAFRQGLNPLMEQLNQYNQLDKPVQDLQTQGSGLQNKLLEAMQRMFPAKAQRELDIRNKFGLEQNVKDLQKLQTLASQKIAAFDAGITAQEGKVIPMEAIAGRQSFLQRQKSVELGGIATMAAALQGNIELAQSYAKSTVELEFAPQQAELDILQKQLDYNKENLTSAEKRRGEQLDIQLKERQAELDDAKIEKEGILKIGIEAAKNGADAQTLTNISNAKTSQEALRAAGTSLQTTETSITEVDGRRKLINSKTGDTIADLGAIAPEVQSMDGKLLQYNPLTGDWDVVYQPEAGVDGAAVEWAALIANGQAKLNEVPSELRSDVAKALNSLPPKQEDIAAIQDKIDTIDKLLNNPGFDSAVGSTFLTRGNKLNWTAKLSGSTQDFVAGVQQLLSEKTLQSLIDAKANGATFGALSEGELKVLQEAATKIGNWVVKDKNGNVIGYKASQKAFAEELNKIKASYTKLIQGNTQTPDSKLQTFYNENPDQRQYIDQLEELKYSPDEIMQVLGLPLTKVDSDTNKAMSLKTLNIGNKNIQVDSSIADKLAMADKDFFKATGQHLQINQSFRTKEQQAKLYAELSKKGARVAPPGKSFHEKGLAIDVTNWKEAEKYLRKYGLKNNLADDKGHFSFGEFA